MRGADERRRWGRVENLRCVSASGAMDAARLGLLSSPLCLLAPPALTQLAQKIRRKQFRSSEHTIVQRI
jgi:hypothetical protein